MKEELPEASRWRVELASELVAPYAEHEKIAMIVLGGSSVKGLSDAYSDLDIVVYWSDLDLPWLEAGPLKGLGPERFAMSRIGSAQTVLETYYLDGLKVDFGHVTLEQWESMTREVIEDLSVSPPIQKTLGGFLESRALHGRELAARWKEKVAYPEGLAERMVRSNLGFYNRGVLLHQGFERGDKIFYYDGLSNMLKRFLGILAGLNRVYFSTDEPRWIEYELGRMEIRPGNMLERMHSLYESEPAEAEEILHALVLDVLALVEKHMPAIDLTRLKRFLDREVEPCAGKPQWKRP